MLFVRTAIQYNKQSNSNSFRINGLRRYFVVKVSPEMLFYRLITHIVLDENTCLKIFDTVEIKIVLSSLLKLSF